MYPCMTCGALVSDEPARTRDPLTPFRTYSADGEPHVCEVPPIRTRYLECICGAMVYERDGQRFGMGSSREHTHQNATRLPERPPAALPPPPPAPPKGQADVPVYERPEYQ